MLLGIFCVALPLWFGVSLFLAPSSYSLSARRWFWLATLPTLGMIAGSGVASLKADSPHLSPPELLAAVVVLPLVAGAIAALVSMAAVAVSREFLGAVQGGKSPSLAGDGLFRLCWGATATLAPLVSLAFVSVQHRSRQDSLIQPSDLREYALLAGQQNELARRAGAADAIAVGLLLLAVVLLTAVVIRARMRLHGNNGGNEAQR